MLRHVLSCARLGASACHARKVREVCITQVLQGLNAPMNAPTIGEHLTLPYEATEGSAENPCFLSDRSKTNVTVVVGVPNPTLLPAPPTRLGDTGSSGGWNGRGCDRRKKVNRNLQLTKNAQYGVLARTKRS